MCLRSHRYTRLRWDSSKKWLEQFNKTIWQLLVDNSTDDSNSMVVPYKLRQICTDNLAIICILGQSTTFAIVPGTIWWQITKSIKVIFQIVALSLSFCDIKLENFDLEKLGQGHGVQHSQWCHSMENIKIYKCYIFALFPFSNHFQDSSISNFFTLKICQVYRVQLPQPSAFRLTKYKHVK